MKIGILDIDGHNFPNLALMKISAWHKAQGDDVEFADMFGDYDVLYKSKVFTFSPDDEYAYRTKETRAGGTGYMQFETLPDEIEHIMPDYSLYGCQHAYGFLTRGCVRRCPACIVPRKEGESRAHADIDEFLGKMKSAVLMDNNVIAHEHGIMQIEKIIEKRIAVDFNQGIDARLIDNATARLLSRVKWLAPLRLACDNATMIEPVRKAVELLRWHNCTPARYFCYVLVDDVPDALERVRFLKTVYVDPFAQAFIDYSGKRQPTREQIDFCRWVNDKAIFKSTPFEEYNRSA